MPSFSNNYGIGMSLPSIDFNAGQDFHDYGAPRNAYKASYGTTHAQLLAPMLPHPYKHCTHPMPSVYRQQSASHVGRNHEMSILAPLQHGFSSERMQKQSYNAHANAAYVERQRQYQPCALNTAPAAVKEEKAIGGVSATLDYDMNEMTSFVTEMTVGVYDFYLSPLCLADIDVIRSIRPGAMIDPTFQKWVCGVLNATRLPSATILLSLSYLGLRIRYLRSYSQFRSSERSLYQMLTIALILGSKFLDDNTFQNKSWAEVSNIGVAELNREERDWLISFDHRLHHDPSTADGFSAWQEQWRVYLARYVHIAAPVAKRHFDTSLGRTSSRMTSPTRVQLQMTTHSSESLYGETCSSIGNFAAFDPWHSQRAPGERSPSSSTYTGPNTPEYYAAHAPWAPLSHYTGRSCYGYQVPSQTSQYSQYPSNYSSQSYSQLAPTSWNCHGSACQCGNCRLTQFTAPRYGPIVATG